jgi:hypothetical protein
MISAAHESFSEFYSDYQSNEPRKNLKALQSNAFKFFLVVWFERKAL